MEWLIFGSATLLLGGYIGLNLYSNYMRVDSEETARLLTQATVVEENLGLQLLAVDRSLASIRDDLPIFTVGNTNRTLVQRRLQAMSTALPGVRTILILDASGTIRASNREQLIGSNFLDREYFQAARDGGDQTTLYVSSPVKTVLGVYAMNVSKVMRDDRNQFTGVIVATLDPEYFQTLLNSVRYAPDMLSSLIHGDGKVVFRVPDTQGIVGLNLAQPGSFFSEQMRTGSKTSVFRGKLQTTGEVRLAIERIIQPSGILMDKPLVIAVSRQLPVLYAAWWRDAYRQGLVFGALLLSSTLMLLLYLHRQISADRFRAKYEAERKRTDDLNAWLGAIVAQSDEVISVTRNGRRIYANPAAIKLFGAHAEEELIGMSILDQVHPDFRQTVLTRLNSLTSKGSRRAELKLLRLDGTPIDVEVQSTEIVFAGDKAILSSIRDITERKRAETALSKIRELHRETEHIGKVGGWELDIDTGKQTWTEETYHIHELDLDYEPTIEKGVSFYTPTSRPIIELAVRRAIEQGEPFDLELEIVTAKGNVRSVHAIGKADLESRRVFGFFQDISERKQAELRLRSGSDVGELLANIPAMHVDGCRRYPQGSADLGRALAIGEQAQDVPLPRSENGRRGGIRRAVFVASKYDEIGDLGGQERVTGDHRLNRAQQIGYPA